MLDRLSALPATKPPDVSDANMMLDELIRHGVVEAHPIPEGTTVLDVYHRSKPDLWVNQQLEHIRLEKELESLKAEIARCPTDQDEIDRYMANQIQLLHDYNDIKDIGQMLLGLCAVREGTTTRNMYKRFGLAESD